MTAVEKNLQDQLERVAKQAEGTSEETEDEALEEETTETEETDESTEEEVDSNPDGTDEETSKEEERKQASAFAAMRKRLKELEEENKTLKAQKPKVEEEQEESDESEDSKPAQTELEKRLADAEKYIQEMRAKEQKDRIANEVITLQQKYGLNNDQLTEFADELEKRGFQIGNTSMTLVDMYAAINHENLVQAEVERVKKEIAQQSNETPPSTGPKPNTSGDTKQKDDIRKTIARVASKIS